MNTLHKKLLRLLWLVGIAYVALILYAVGVDMPDCVKGAFIGVSVAALMID